MFVHSDMLDAGRRNHFEIDRLLGVLEGEGTMPDDVAFALGQGIYFLAGSNTQREEDGNWRIIVVDPDLVIQVRASGSWGNVARFEP